MALRRSSCRCSRTRAFAADRNAKCRLLGISHRVVAFHDCGLAKILVESSSTDRPSLRYPVAGQVMIGALLRDLQQPENVYVLLNPLPVYGLLIGLIGLVLALVLKSRRAQIATLTLVFISCASAWPVYEFGQQSYDRVLSMTDEDGGAWLDEHMHRAEELIWIFYVLVALSAIALAAPIKWPRSSLPLAVAVVLLGAITLGSGIYIGYAGGRARHRE